MNKSFNKLIKSNLLLAVLSVFTVILLVSSVSYSLFIKEDKNSTNQTISIGDLSASASSSTFTLSGMYPETESSALAKSDNIYTFTLTNDGDYWVKYNVYLSVSSDTLTSDYYQYINFKLDNGAIMSLNDIYSSEKFYIISDGILKSNITESHTIRFWLSEDVPNDVIDREIVFNLVFNATVDKKYSTITFDAGQGVPSENTQIKYLGHSYGDLPIAYLNGFKLDGWYTDTNYTTEVTTLNVDSSVNDRTLYAKYSALNAGENLLATELVMNVYGTENSYLYHHLNTANGNYEDSIDGWKNQNANDGGYRYSGPDASVNNYICFGTTDLATCKGNTDNNGASKYLYRIIGVFNGKVKIILANPLYIEGSSSFYWDQDVNLWETAGLKQWLNGETIKSGYESSYPATTFMSLYDTSPSTIWADKIATYNWVVGGTSNNDYYVKEIYDYEKSGNCYKGTSEQVCNPVNAKVGLISFSDYGYAASPTYWNSIYLYSYDEAVNDNWLVTSDPNNTYEWAINSQPNSSYSVSAIYFTGRAGGWYIGEIGAIRPSMYLKADTIVTAGNGSIDNPYIIK